MRAAEGVVVLEGAELLGVALDAGVSIEAVYVSPKGRTSPAASAVVDRAFGSGVRVYDLSEGVVERIADTVTAQPVLAVAAYSSRPLDAVLEERLLVVGVDLRDPGNVGTVIRTADAAGAGGVVLCQGSVDPTNPKTVRSSAGSLFHLPVVLGGDPSEVLSRLTSAGFTTVGTLVRSGEDYSTFDWNRPVAIVLGNEAAGLPDDLARSLSARVTIPMAGRAESLNVSAAAAVLCFEAARQQRSA